MTCREVLDRVEAIAAEEEPLDAAMRAHFESCPACAAALAAARTIEGYLTARPVVAAPPRFTSNVLARIRRERWRSEQRVDRLFNVAMVFAAVIIVTGAGFLFNMSAVIELAGDASRVLSTAATDVLRRAALSIGTYLAASALLLGALVMWWWADMSTE